MRTKIRSEDVLVRNLQFLSNGGKGADTQLLW